MGAHRRQQRWSTRPALQNFGSRSSQWPVVKPLTACLILVLAVAGAGCSSSSRHAATHRPPPEPPRIGRVAGVQLVPSLNLETRPGSTLRDDCRWTARSIGYSVACPGLLPHGAVASAAGPACPEKYVARFMHPACTGGRLALLSIEWADPRRVGHLVIVATAGALPPRSAVTAPVRPLPEDHIRVLQRTRFRGHLARWLSVPSAPSSAFSHHLVLYWVQGAHAYLVGFHGLDKGARALDLKVAKSVRLIEP